MFLQTIYYPLELFANNSSGKSLELFVDSPTYKTAPRRCAVPGRLRGLRQRNAGHERRQPPPGFAHRGRVRRPGPPFPGAWEVAEVNGPDIKAQNDFGVTKVETKHKKFDAGGNVMRYTLPPHSFTMLKGQA